MEERLSIQKYICDKQVTLKSNNLEMYGAHRYKATFHKFFLYTDDIL